MVAPLIELDLFVQREKLSVNPSAQKAVLRELLEIFLKLAFAASHDRGEDHHALTLREREDVLDDLLDALASDLCSTDLTMGMAYGREEKSQVIVNLCHGSNRRSRTARSRF